MDGFKARYFGHVLAKEYGEQNARTNDMKPTFDSTKKERDHRYLVFDLSNPRATTYGLDRQLNNPIDASRSPSARSVSHSTLDDALASARGIQENDSSYGLSSRDARSTAYGLPSGRDGSGSYSASTPSFDPSIMYAGRSSQPPSYSVGR